MLTLIFKRCTVEIDSNNINDFPKIQICTNINKQHLNFLKKSLDEVIKEDVGFLCNFDIYIGKQSSYVLKKLNTFKNKAELFFQILGNSSN